ncbi:MAG: YceI family protein [Planctomycetaceae bacterium]|nr:YceI family protein [Planctomycetaceae bacterium]
MSIGRHAVDLGRRGRHVVKVTLPFVGMMIGLFAPAGVQSRGSFAIPAETPKSPTSGDVDTASSRVYIYVPKAGLGHDHAIEGKLKSGRLQLGEAQDAGELLFDMSSFDADTAAARRYIGLPGATDAGTRREVNANMLGADVLSVRRFPTATFAITSAELSNQPGRRGAVYQLTGKFTLHGTTRALTVNAEAEKVDGRIHVKGKFPLVQTHYGIQPFTKAFGAVGVANQLTVHADLWIADKPSENKGATP